MEREERQEEFTCLGKSVEGQEQNRGGGIACLMCWWPAEYVELFSFPSEGELNSN